MARHAARPSRNTGLFQSCPSGRGQHNCKCARRSCANWHTPGPQTRATRDMSETGKVDPHPAQRPCPIVVPVAAPPGLGVRNNRGRRAKDRHGQLKASTPWLAEGENHPASTSEHGKMEGSRRRGEERGCTSGSPGPWRESTPSRRLLPPSCPQPGHHPLRRATAQCQVWRQMQPWKRMEAGTCPAPRCPSICPVPGGFSPLGHQEPQGRVHHRSTRPTELQSNQGRRQRARGETAAEREVAACPRARGGSVQQAGAFNS